MHEAYGVCRGYYAEVQRVPSTETLEDPKRHKVDVQTLAHHRFQRQIFIECMPIQLMQGRVANWQ